MFKQCIRIFLPLCAVVLLMCGSAFASGKTLVNGIDYGFPPFGYVNDKGAPAGFDVESVNWIAKEMGLTVKHQPMDWDGIIPALNAGKLDFIASGMTITEERKKLVNFTIPYFEVTQVLVSADSEAMDLDAMLKSGKKIGVQRGTPTNTLLKELAAKPGNNFELVEYDSTDLSMQDLKIGRIIASGMDSTIAGEMMAKMNGLKVAGTFEGEPEKYGYAVRKEDTELLETLNKGLEKLMKDPYWQELKTKHGVH